MSFADVESKTTIDDRLGAATILAAMRTAYEGSATARAMFDSWISVPTNTITIGFLSGQFQAYLNTGELEIDLNNLTQAMYIDNNGTAVKDTAVTAIVHELVHALTGRLDNPELFISNVIIDYRQPTVTYSNIIYKELGLPEQNSYIAYDAKGDILTLGFQYTNGAAIDRSFVMDDNWNSSNVGNSNDLLIGGASGNVLSAGDGNDFLYGNGGDDTLDGGSGNDALYGGLDDDVLVGGEEYGDERVHKDSNGNLYVDVGSNRLVIDGNVLILDHQDGELSLNMIGPEDLPNPITGNTIQLTDLTDLEKTQFDYGYGGTIFHFGNEYDDGTYQQVYERGTGQYKYGSNGGDPDYHPLFEDQIALYTNGTPSPYSGIAIYASAARFGAPTAASDHIIGSASDDRIYALVQTDLGGNDLIETGAGHDFVSSGAGDDVISGGSDSDILAGGAGEDRLYGDIQISAADAIAAGNQNAGTGQRGDWLSGGEDDDTLIGGNGNDVLMGGAGADLLIGGAGDDNILGDTDWVATKFEWITIDQPGIRYFYPVDSNARPVDGAGEDRTTAHIRRDTACAAPPDQPTPGKVRAALPAQRGHGAGIPVRPALDGGDCAAFSGALLDGEPGGNTA